MEEERKKLLTSLTLADMDLLTDAQLRLATQAQIKRYNNKAREKMKELIGDKVEDVLRAMSEEPFVYKTPAMKVMAGCEIRLATLTGLQLEDAQKQVDAFSRDENPNDIRYVNALNRHFLAHSLVEYNGKPFGGVDMPDDFHKKLANEQAEAMKTLAHVRDERLKALSNLPTPVFQRLAEYYQVFQMTIEAMTRGEAIAEVLGN